MGNIANNDDTALRLLVMETASLLDEHKGGDTVILEVMEECAFTDFFVITTAQSSRHLASLVGYAREFLRPRGVSVLNRIQPNDISGWALLDCGRFVIHVMEQAERLFYELEKLWFRSRTLTYSSKSS
jgi:ribosome-associated protein